MSAFVVSRETMQRCVTALHEYRHESCEQADQLGRELFALNEQAVNCRYGSSDPTGAIYADWQWKVTCPLIDGHGMPVERKTACEWLKALHCLRYQLTEGEQFTSHLLYERIERRIRQIESHLATSLPEYEAAPWDYETADQLQHKAS